MHKVTSHRGLQGLLVLKRCFHFFCREDIIQQTPELSVKTDHISTLTLDRQSWLQEKWRTWSNPFTQWDFSSGVGTL
jgi:hypothetical protein